MASRLTHAILRIGLTESVRALVGVDGVAVATQEVDHGRRVGDAEPRGDLVRGELRAVLERAQELGFLSVGSHSFSVSFHINMSIKRSFSSTVRTRRLG